MWPRWPQCLQRGQRRGGMRAAATGTAACGAARLPPASAGILPPMAPLTPSTTASDGMRAWFWPGEACGPGRAPGMRGSKGLQQRRAARGSSSGTPPTVARAPFSGMCKSRAHNGHPGARWWSAGRKKRRGQAAPQVRCADQQPSGLARGANGCAAVMAVSSSPAAC